MANYIKEKVIPLATGSYTAYCITNAIVSLAGAAIANEHGSEIGYYMGISSASWQATKLTALGGAVLTIKGLERLLQSNEKTQSK
ncbi:MAG: hypothetical protein ACI83O_000207 [Patescibacteria group bacterium]|jgi:hypothetical protein